VVYLGVNCETRALLEQWNFCAKTVDKACDFLDWLAWDTYEFLVVLILISHPLASSLMYLLCVKFVIVLIITAFLVLIIFLMKVLLDLVI